MSWIRVKKSEPCPVCNNGGWCLVSDDGDSAMCMRVQSNKPFNLASGEIGYIHRLAEPTPKAKWVRHPRKTRVAIDAAAMFHKAELETSFFDVEELAGSLGVNPHALSDIGCARFKKHRAWGFPMRDGGYNIIGIRLRGDDGSKWAVTGSRSGLFYPLTEPASRLVVTEGPTDCAAALSCGLFALGRASCSSGGEMIKWFIEYNRQIKEVVIIADNDKPGLDGANKLQQMLNIRSCVVTLPCKDMREFHKMGGNAELLSCIIKNTHWFNPSR